MIRQLRRRRAPKKPRPTSPLLFQDALLAVSVYLTEAQFAAERGDSRRKEELLFAAEMYAVLTGYLELMLLVWAYSEAPRRTASLR